MNKDVVYIEPDEDITDVISKIEGAKNKIVAVVPPKKSGVFKSIVNIRLITKSAANAKKTVVLVTTDPGIIKLAAATRMPVTKDLNTAPEIPETDEAPSATTEESIEEVDAEAEEIEINDNGEGDAEDTEEDNLDEDAEESEEDETETDARHEKSQDSSSRNNTKSVKRAEKDVLDDFEGEEPEEGGSHEKPLKNTKNSEKQSKKGVFYKLSQSDNKFLAWIGGHPKITIGTGVGVILLIIFAVWALKIAPAVTVTVELETVTGNFSENISFTEAVKDENISDGVFYIEQKKQENKTEVEFEATGKKNVGEKATGKIKVTHYFPIDSEEGGKIAITSGATFTNSGLTYTVTSGATIAWDGDLKTYQDDCENSATAGWRSRGCAVSATVTVEATEAGAKYNISGTSSGWSSSVSGLDTISNEAFTGGSDKTVTVVQQSDIDAALTKITDQNESVNKEKLLETLGEDDFVIDSSFKQTTGNPVSSPEVDKEVEEGKKAKLTVTTTDTIYVLDLTKVKEFIAEKAKIEKGYKIYEMNDPFIENFSQTTGGYTGKLKTSYVAGSTLTENDVVQTVKGKGIGTAKRDLTDGYDGIKSVNFDTSVPWVSSVPDNPEKITVNIEVKEQK